MPIFGSRKKLGVEATIAMETRNLWAKKKENIS